MKAEVAQEVMETVEVAAKMVFGNIASVVLDESDSSFSTHSSSSSISTMTGDDVKSSTALC